MTTAGLASPWSPCCPSPAPDSETVERAVLAAVQGKLFFQGLPSLGDTPRARKQPSCPMTLSPLSLDHLQDCGVPLAPPRPWPQGSPFPIVTLTGLSPVLAGGSSPPHAHGDGTTSSLHLGLGNHTPYTARHPQPRPVTPALGRTSLPSVPQQGPASHAQGPRPRQAAPPACSADSPFSPSVPAGPADLTGVVPPPGVPSWAETTTREPAVRLAEAVLPSPKSLAGAD